MNNSERIARLATAAAERVEDGMLVGLGTGSTAAAMVDALGRRVAEGLRFTGVATSIATAEQAQSLGIPLKELIDIDRLDLCIDGADEIDPALNLVKGRGGALLFEKLVARRANRYLIIAASDKLVDHLGTRLPLPVEIVTMGWTHTADALIDLDLRPHLRRNADDTPYVTDGGHYIVDCDWPSDHQVDPGSLASAVKALTGVVDHGLFIQMATEVLTIDENGDLTERRA
ncbi:MAG TPA: ribose-5-phosphate isomerase RpiA [Thermomicrobiales bacterium]|nr:ribose-5-phosphate isomerase RpiA [Thermomicrobiales bacterium]